MLNRQCNCRLVDDLKEAKWAEIGKMQPRHGANIPLIPWSQLACQGQEIVFAGLKDVIEQGVTIQSHAAA